MSRNACINKVQKDMLIEFLEKNKQLQSGCFTPTFTFKAAQKLLQEITNILNSILGGANKEWRQWRKTWQDLKKNAKLKATKSKQSAEATGGGTENIIELNPGDERILSMMIPTQITGLANISETPIKFDFTDIEKENEVAQTCSQNFDQDMKITNENLLKDEVQVDHSYTLPSERKVITRSRRLDDSIKSSKELFGVIERKTDIVKEYYMVKQKYLEHKQINDKKKLKVLEQKNDILNKLNSTLEKMVNLKK